jgi:hypothetical protein
MILGSPPNLLANKKNLVEVACQNDRVVTEVIQPGELNGGHCPQTLRQVANANRYALIP